MIEGALFSGQVYLNEPLPSDRRNFGEISLLSERDFLRERCFFEMSSFFVARFSLSPQRRAVVEFGLPPEDISTLVPFLIDAGEPWDFAKISLEELDASGLYFLSSEDPPLCSFYEIFSDHTARPFFDRGNPPVSGARILESTFFFLSKGDVHFFLS